MANSTRSYSVSRRRNRRLRLVVLVSILAVVTALGILHQFPLGLRPPGVDALCPFGGIEAFFTLVASGNLMERVAVSSFVLLGATVVVALVFRRSFCGTICPLGTLQELAARLGRKLFRRRFTVPRVVDRPARYLKYLVLVALIALSALFGELIVRPYDPWAAYQHLITAELISGFLVGLIVLSVSLVGSLLYDRFFCKYLCPMGALLGLIGKIGWFRVRREPVVCTSCGACDRACPVNLPVSTSSEIRSAECIACNQCVMACPVKGALEVVGPVRVQTAGGGRRAIRSRTYLLATAGVFAALILGTSLAGWFQWKVPTITEASERSGSFDAGDIKGSDTFAAVAEAAGVSKEALIERFAITDEEFGGPIKNVAHRSEAGFEVQEVRDFVSELRGDKKLE